MSDWRKLDSCQVTGENFYVRFPAQKFLCKFSQVNWGNAVDTESTGKIGLCCRFKCVPKQWERNKLLRFCEFSVHKVLLKKSFCTGDLRVFLFECKVVSVAIKLQVCPKRANKCIYNVMFQVSFLSHTCPLDGSTLRVRYLQDCRFYQQFQSSSLSEVPSACSGACNALVGRSLNTQRHSVSDQWFCHHRSFP